MNRTIVTIGREFGSGGHIIAQKLAGLLRIPFYDRELISLAAKETGLSERFIGEAEEQKTSGFVYNLYYGWKELPLYDQIFLAECEIIRRAAAQGACVILGRCADYALRDNPHCLNVFIHAPIEMRVRRAKEEYGVEAVDAEAFVLRKDKARASYYSHFTTGKWGVAQNYHLAISSAMGIDAVARVIAELAKERESAA